ncbi:unnamed protein product, partial [Closterium sp. NIES-53]
GSSSPSVGKMASSSSATAAAAAAKDVGSRSLKSAAVDTAIGLTASAATAAATNPATNPASTAAATAATTAATAATRKALAAAATAPPLQPSMSHVVGMILRKEGVRGLWRGTGPTCVRLGLGLGLFFATLDPAMHALAALENTVEEKRRQRRRKGREEGGVGEEEEKGGAMGADGRKGGVSGGVTGAGAGAAQFSSRVTFMAAVVSRSLAAAALCPVSVVKTRMEVSGS